MLLERADLLADVGRKQAGVERDDRLALAIEHFQHALFQHLDLRLRLIAHDLDAAVGLVDFALGFARRGSGEYDIGGADPVPDLAQDRLGNFLDLGRPQQIRLVDHQQHRLVQITKLLERIDLDAVEIAVGDEQHEIGVAHRFLGELAAQFAGRLVDAGRVDQDEPGVLEARFRNLVGRAVLGGHRENLLAGERIEERALAGADLAERRDLDPSVLELGGEFLDVLHLLFDAGALLRAQPRILRELAERLDRIRQNRLVFHASELPRLSRAFEAERCAAPGASTRPSKFTNAETSPDGRRTSTRTAPRASSISRSTGIGAAATDTT